MALLDAQVGVLANQAMNYLVSGAPPKRMGNAHPNIVPYQVFPVADGYAIVAVGNDAQLERLCGLLGAPDLAQTPPTAPMPAASATERRSAPVWRTSRPASRAPTCWPAWSGWAFPAGRSTMSRRCSRSPRSSIEAFG